MIKPFDTIIRNEDGVNGFVADVIEMLAATYYLCTFGDVQVVLRREDFEVVYKPSDTIEKG